MVTGLAEGRLDGVAVIGLSDGAPEGDSTGLSDGAEVTRLVEGTPDGEKVIGVPDGRLEGTLDG
jgi:hypothetical protein